MEGKLSKTDKELLRGRFRHKPYELGRGLLENDVRGEDFEYIMQGGEEVSGTAKKQLQEWISGAMHRMEERIPKERLKTLREGCACCLHGQREEIAQRICAEHETLDERFEALSREPYIIGGKAWKEADGVYCISFWHDMPVGGYKCSCIKYVPKKEAMSNTWCLCCGGHIKHHFETALGVKADCEFVSSSLTTCGKEPCLFRLRVVERLM